MGLPSKESESFVLAPFVQASQALVLLCFQRDVKNTTSSLTSLFYLLKMRRQQAENASPYSLRSCCDLMCLVLFFAATVVFVFT